MTVVSAELHDYLVSEVCTVPVGVIRVLGFGARGPRSPHDLDGRERAKSLARALLESGTAEQVFLLTNGRVYEYDRAVGGIAEVTRGFYDKLPIPPPRLRVSGLADRLAASL